MVSGVCPPHLTCRRTQLTPPGNTSHTARRQPRWHRLMLGVAALDALALLVCVFGDYRLGTQLAGLCNLSQGLLMMGACLRAVAAAAPDSRFIVDPNEGWTFDILDGLKSLLADLPIALVEQPLPADADHDLEGWDPPFTVCADESVHVGGDLAALKGRYQAVNLKLDKTGGLTEAVAMLKSAKALGFQVMTGCMVASSLGVAPALHLGGASDFADLDGPWWLATDHPGGLRVERGRITPPQAGFWGDATEAEGLWL